MRKMLGDRIYELRKMHGFTQEELADKLGVSNKAVSKWETNEANPDITLIPEIAKIFNVTTDELFGDGTGKPANEKPKENETPKADCKVATVLGQKGVEKRDGTHYEFISNKKNDKGDPVVHINVGLGFYKAQGTIAIGIISKGKVSIGIISAGLVSIGVLSAGLVALGMFAAGLLFAFGSFAVGIGVSLGAIAVGSVALGGISIGIISLGAIAVGIYAYSGGNGMAIGLFEYMDGVLVSGSRINPYSFINSAFNVIKEFNIKLR